MSLARIATRNVVSIDPKASVRDASKKMRDRNVGDLVVVGEKGGRRVPIGILTDRDIVVSCLAFGVSPDEVVVEDLMSSSLVCARISDSLWHVLSVMKEHGFKRIPLVNEVGELSGIISSDDIIALLGAELTGVSKIQSRRQTLEQERKKVSA